jgi:hypothetical protein
MVFFITIHREEWHSVFRSFPGNLEFNERRQVTGVGRNAFGVLQKAKKGLEFNSLARRLASFWQFRSSKVERNSLKGKS